MQPFELRTSSFRFRDESQLQPWREDDRIHGAAPLRHSVHFGVIGAFRVVRVSGPLNLAEICAFILSQEQYKGACAYHQVAWYLMWQGAQASDC